MAFLQDSAPHCLAYVSTQMLQKLKVFEQWHLLRTLLYPPIVILKLVCRHSTYQGTDAIVCFGHWELRKYSQEVLLLLMPCNRGRDTQEVRLLNKFTDDSKISHSRHIFITGYFLAWEKHTKIMQQDIRQTKNIEKRQKRPQKVCMILIKENYKH